MKRIRQVFAITCENFLKWDKNPRVYLTFFCAFLLCLMLSDEVLKVSKQYETILQAFEPYIWTFGDSDSILLSSLILLLLFADMPFVDLSTPYRLIRTNRNIWLIGQILYVFLGTVIYNIFLLVTEAAITAPRAYFGNVWSDTAALLAYGQGSKVYHLPVSLKIMQNLSPYSCAVTVLLLMTIYSLFLMCSVLWINLHWGNVAGVIGGLSVSLYGFLIEPSVFQKMLQIPERNMYKANALAVWLSPLNQATFSMHSFGYDYLPSLQSSFLFFGILILIFLLLSCKAFRKYNFYFGEKR